MRVFYCRHKRCLMCKGLKSDLMRFLLFLHQLFGLLIYSIYDFIFSKGSNTTFSKFPVSLRQFRFECFSLFTLLFFLSFDGISNILWIFHKLSLYSRHSIGSNISGLCFYSSVFINSFSSFYLGCFLLDMRICRFRKSFISTCWFKIVFMIIRFCMHFILIL